MKLEERMEKIANAHNRHARKLTCDLNAFATLLVAFASIIFSAHFESPIPLFLFCAGSYLFFLLKPVK
jgi:hypothetical protein